MKAQTFRRVAALLVFSSLLGVGWSRRAEAQGTPARTDTTFSPQLFHPTVGPDEFFTVEPAKPLAHLNFSLGLWLNYSVGEFALHQVVNENGSDRVGPSLGTPIEHALATDVVFAFGLFDRLQLGIGLPVTLYQRGDTQLTFPNGNMYPIYANGAPKAFALGDPWLDVKLRIYGHDRGVQVGVAGFVTAPLSNLVSANSFGGDKGVDAGGRLLAGWEAERWRAGLNLGFLWRQDQSQFYSSTVGNQLTYAAALAYDALAGRKVTIVGELFGRADVSNRDAKGNITLSNLNGNPLELDLGAKFRFQQSLYLTVGAGAGLVQGMGAPFVRIFGGLTWSPDRRDRDHDGVPDVDDKCPDVPEDRDGFKDDDGCPDPDNDGDGIPDGRDKCPNEAEDFDGFEDEDGCPDPDNDKDGIPDIKDACPMDKEDGKPPKPNDGCPLDKTDSDGDGIPDNKDKCPLDPEDKDGFEDDDGCPDIDNDNDGIPDQFDKCPNAPEDFDKFEDEDGCPDPDNDNDGIPDTADKCPNEPETVNGFQDEDGCPDKGPPLKVQIVGDEIVILEKVFFKTGKSVIEPRSFNLLDQVASVLKLHPEIKKVEIQGHTDSKGSLPKNMKLSQDRANAVRLYELNRGVEPIKLIAKGYGPTQPVADNKTDRGREANRRVQFKILVSDKLQPAAPAPAGDAVPSGDAVPPPPP